MVVLVGSSSLLQVVLMLCTIHQAPAFVSIVNHLQTPRAAPRSYRPQPSESSPRRRCGDPRMTRTTSISTTAVGATVSLSLPKPLGLILEEVEEGKAAGVFVKEVGDAGSAAPHAGEISGMSLITVQGENVAQLDFDSVMDKIIYAPDTVDLVFFKEGSTLPIGTPVTIKVQEQDGREGLTINAAVGDNLRKTLMDNGFEVYQGMQKLSNCGGAGQCTLCAMDFIETGEGWDERSEYEDAKLKRNPMARLSCLNIIQGSAVIRKANR